MRDFGYKKPPLFDDFLGFGSKLAMILTALQGWLCILWKSKRLIYMFAPKSYYLIHTFFFFPLVFSALFVNELIFPEWNP